MSLLNLAQDIGRLAVYGKLKNWLDAYAVFANRIREWLFGWIDFAWINISRDEMHLLILVTLLGGASARAAYFDAIDATNDLREARTAAASMIVVVAAIPLIGILCLPGEYGVIVSVLYVIMASSALLFEPYSKALPSGLIVWKELAPIVVLFLVIVAVNHAIVAQAS